MMRAAGALLGLSERPRPMAAFPVPGRGPAVNVMLIDEGLSLE